MAQHCPELGLQRDTCLRVSWRVVTGAPFTVEALTHSPLRASATPLHPPRYLKLCVSLSLTGGTTPSQPRWSVPRRPGLGKAHSSFLIPALPGTSRSGHPELMANKLEKLNLSPCVLLSPDGVGENGLQWGPFHRVLAELP